MRTAIKARGFTLIELLVVIAIIGVLASIVLASLNGAKKKGSDSRIVSDVRELRTQIENDRTPADYSNSFVVIVGTVATFGSATLTQYATAVSDAESNSPITNPTASSTYSTVTSSNISGNLPRMPAIPNGPEITIVENGTIASGAWSPGKAPTAYSLWGYLNNGSYFCVDSAGNVKNGTTNLPTTITCQ